MTIYPQARFYGSEWPVLEFLYTNHKMETEHRKAKPVSFWFGHSEFHQGEQCFMEAIDLDKNESRNFAVRDMRAVRTKPEQGGDVDAEDAIGDALHAIKQGHRDIAVECLERAIGALQSAI